MTAVVDHQGTFVEEFEQALAHGGVAMPGSRHLHRIGIPVDTLHHIVGVVAFEHLYHLLGIAHVLVVVAIVAQHEDGVLPCAGIGIVHITDYFVYGITGLRYGGHGEASDADIHLVVEQAAALTVVEQTEVVLHHIRRGGTERTFCFKA